MLPRMVTLLVSSASDTASMNLRQSMLAACSWTPITSTTTEVHHASGERGDVYMMHFTDAHMTVLDGVDATFEREVGTRADEIVFLSKHTAASGTPALCVHPIGVAAGAEARHGGAPGRYPPPAPLLAPAYRLLRKAAKAKGGLLCAATGAAFETSLEATHHGPLLDTPCIFVEIGSSDAQYDQAPPAALWSEVLMALLFEASGPPRWRDLDAAAREQATVVVGLGGGHYQPKVGDFVAANDDVFLGHMLASYSFVDDEASWQTSVAAAIDATRTSFPGVRDVAVRVEKKAFKGAHRARLLAFLEARGHACTLV